MKYFLSIALLLLITLSAKCQLSEVIYLVDSNDTISAKEYPTEWSRWEVSEETIKWQWFNEDSILLLNNRYTVISKEKTEKGFDYLCLVQDENEERFIIEFWILADKTKSVSHHYADEVVYYSGNVSF